MRQALRFISGPAALNSADQNASIQFEYRLSPHVTFSARDGFQKTSNVFNQPVDFASSGAVSGGAQGANFSVIAPIADQLSNSGNVGISDQFALNDMVGASGTFSNLHFPNSAQVPGLYDSSSQGGLAFYSHRVARQQYLGISYGYQRLISYPTQGINETQTHAVLLFYTFSPTSSRFSFSLFGGPQYSDTVEPPVPPKQLQSTRDALVESCWRGQPRLAGKTEQFCIELHAHYFGWWRADRCGQVGQRDGLSAPVDYEDSECLRDWWLQPEQCDRKSVAWPDEWAYDFRNGISAAATGSTSWSAAGVHTASAGLQQRCGHFGDSQYESRICFHLHISSHVL